MEQNNTCVHINSDVIYETNCNNIPIDECVYCFDSPVIIF
jgi:hypothetical protein